MAESDDGACYRSKPMVRDGSSTERAHAQGDLSAVSPAQSAAPRVDLRGRRSTLGRSTLTSLRDRIRVSPSLTSIRNRQGWDPAELPLMPSAIWHRSREVRLPGILGLVEEPCSCARPRVLTGHEPQHAATESSVWMTSPFAWSGARPGHARRSRRRLHALAQP